MTAFGTAVTTTPALALIDRDRRVARSTDAFDALSLDLTGVCQGSPEIDRALSGNAESGTVTVGETHLTISAVTDASGLPQALLSGPRESPPAEAPTASSPGDWMARLRPALDDIPALAWLKDMAGRHVYVNQPYLDALHVSEDRLLGRTDEELAPAETVDGPRRSIASDGVQESQELEYTVPVFADRPAFAAVRFLIRDPGGRALGLCGLAAPLAEAQMVRDEAGRLLGAERGLTVGPAASLAEVLHEWGVTLVSQGTDPLPAAAHLQPESQAPPEPQGWPEPPSAGLGGPMDRPQAPEPLPGPPPDLAQSWDECVQRLGDEARRWQNELAESRSVLAQAQERTSEALAGRNELERRLATEQQRNEQLLRTIEQLRTQILDVERTIEHALPAEHEDQDEGPANDYLVGPWEA